MVRSVGGLRRANDLDQLHSRHGVEEVETGKAWLGISEGNHEGGTAHFACLLEEHDSAISDTEREEVLVANMQDLLLPISLTNVTSRRVLTSHDCPGSQTGPA